MKIFHTKTRDENDFDFVLIDFLALMQSSDWLSCWMLQRKFDFGFLSYSQGSMIRVSFVVRVNMISHWVMKFKADAQNHTEAVLFTYDFQA